MLKNKILKVKSAVISGLVAVTALAAPLSSAAPNSLSAEAASSDNYAKLLQYSLYFYDANMCGTQVSEKTQLTWRSDCHTADEVDGGFHDAGDHVMFGLPQGFSASTLGWSYYEFADAYNSLGQTEHFKTISEYFNDFFKASTKLDGSGNVTSFCYQKGEGYEDHNYWGPPESQSNNRKLYWTSNSASDIAAEYAASLALSYINFGDAEDLKYAEALYKFSTQYNSIATDGTSGFYSNTSCQDEQAWAAGWLYLATKNESYKTDCANKQTQYLGWVHGWENVGLGAACVYAHITGDWSKVNSWIGGQCTSNNYYFLDKWGSARLNTSMQFTALVATKNSNADYSAWCKNQMDYILGSNPAKTCFVVGFASNSASKPHHRAASGTSTAEDNSPSKYTLVGALVGGPSDAGGTYQDSRADYICNEVAVDYNAGFVGAAAGLYSIYKSGSLDTSIVGVKSVSTTPVTTTPSTTTTTTYNNNNGNTTTTTTTAPSTQNPSSGAGEYELDVNTKYVYSNFGDDKMIGFAYEDFGLTAGSTEKITKVEVNLSTSNGNIGKWQGAFGSSTKVAADNYWTQTDQMEQSFSGNSGTVTWKVDSATADIIQYGYGGELKFGIWWIDCNEFTIDSITIYTDGKAAATTTTTTTTTTTPRRTTTTTTTTTNTTTAPSVDTVVYGDANSNGTLEVADAVFILQGIADPSNSAFNLSDEGRKRANCNNPNGSGVDTQDALAIQQKMADIIPSLPC